MQKQVISIGALVGDASLRLNLVLSVLTKVLVYYLAGVLYFKENMGFGAAGLEDKSISPLFFIYNFRNSN